MRGVKIITCVFTNKYVHYEGTGMSFGYTTGLELTGFGDKIDRNEIL